MNKLLFSFIFSFLVLSPCLAIEEKTSPIKAYLEETEYLTGEWNGIREELSEKGIDIQSSYMINTFINTPSALSKGTKGSYQGGYNLSGEIDTEKMGLWKGGHFYVLYQAANQGLNQTEYLGTYNYINSYDPMTNISQISEYWYEHEFLDKFRLKIGKQDALADFQALDNGNEFVNLSFGYIPNTPMPFYPVQAMGARLKYDINDKFYLQSGFYDGSLNFGSSSTTFFTGENGYLNLTEVGFTPEINDKKGKYIVGGWFHSADSESIRGSKNYNNNYGFYASFEQKIWNEKDKKSGEIDKNQGLSIFGRFGFAPSNRNILSEAFGGGIVYKGLIPKRNEDAIGVGLSWGRFGSEFKSFSEISRDEKVIEFFYKIKLTKWLTLQPDFQCYLNPMGEDRRAFAFGLRAIINF